MKLLLFPPGEEDDDEEERGEGEEMNFLIYYGRERVAKTPTPSSSFLLLFNLTVAEYEYGVGNYYRVAS